MALIKPHQTSRAGLAVKEGLHFTVFWGLRCFNCAKSWWQRKRAHGKGATWGASAQWGHLGSLWAVVPSAPVRIQLLGREKEVSRFQKGPGEWRESKQRQRPGEEGRLRTEQASLSSSATNLLCSIKHVTWALRGSIFHLYKGRGWDLVTPNFFQLPEPITLWTRGLRALRVSYDGWKILSGPREGNVEGFLCGPANCPLSAVQCRHSMTNTFYFSFYDQFG